VKSISAISKDVEAMAISKTYPSLTADEAAALIPNGAMVAVSGVGGKIGEPGLFIAEIPYTAPRLYLAAGVTTMRTTGSLELVTESPVLGCSAIGANGASTSRQAANSRKVPIVSQPTQVLRNNRYHRSRGERWRLRTDERSEDLRKTEYWRLRSGFCGSSNNS
jgi:hypothetical protein